MVQIACLFLPSEDISVMDRAASLYLCIERTTVIELRCCRDNVVRRGDVFCYAKQSTLH